MQNLVTQSQIFKNDSVLVLSQLLCIEIDIYCKDDSR